MSKYLVIGPVPAAAQKRADRQLLLGIDPSYIRQFFEKLTVDDLTLGYIESAQMTAWVAVAIERAESERG